LTTDAKDDAPTSRIDGVDRIDGFEEQAADRLVERWSREYRQRNPDKLKSSAEIEQVIISSRSDWRAYALAQINSTRALWRARTPAKAWTVSELGPLALSKKTRAKDLSAQIDALQRDLAAFKLSHGGEPELDAQIIAWLKAVCAEP